MRLHSVAFAVSVLVADAVALATVSVVIAVSVLIAFAVRLLVTVGSTDRIAMGMTVIMTVIMAVIMTVIMTVLTAVRDSGSAFSFSGNFDFSGVTECTKSC